MRYRRRFWPRHRRLQTASVNLVKRFTYLIGGGTSMTTDRLMLRQQNILNVLTSLRNEEPMVRGFPVKLTIEPTSICDLRCPLCPTGAGTLRREKGMLSFSNFRKVIDDLDPFLCRVVLWNYGESFINPSIFDMI